MRKSAGIGAAVVLALSLLSGFASAQPLPPTTGMAPCAAPPVYSLAEVETLTGARGITLSLRDVPAREALAALTKSTGVTFLVQSLGVSEALNQRRVTLQVRDAPFWTILTEVLRQSKTCLAPGNDFEILLGEDGLPDLPTVQAWPFSVRALKLERLELASDKKSPANDGPAVRLTLQLQMDPRFPWVGQSGHTSEILEAYDDQGAKLNKRTEVFRLPQDFVRSARLEMPLVLQPLTAASRAISVRGIIRIPAALRSEIWTIREPLVAPVQEREEGGVIHNFYALNAIGDAFKLVYRRAFRITVAGVSPAQALDSQWKLYDAEGRAFFPGKSGWRSTDDGMVHTLIFSRHDPAPKGDHTAPEPIGMPVSASVRVATGMRSIEIPFEFKKLPLP